MDYEAGSRLILDAVLLSLAEIHSDETKGVAILPEKKIGEAEGVQLVHAATGLELWLSGSVDCAVLGYPKILNHEERLLRVEDRRNSITPRHLFLEA